ncbi:MAG: 3-oxoadipyl-CoA thiolase, partial [Planctomycetaceae bacterium]
RRRGIVPLARIVASAVVGVPPALAGTGAGAAIRAVMTKGAVAIDEVDHVEIDEAFAAQVIHNVDALGLDPARVNPLGGSLALGRPRGASGARIVTTLLHALARGGGRVGAAAASVGFGQGIALLVEREPA